MSTKESKLKLDRHEAAKALWYARQRIRWAEFEPQSYWLYSAGRWSAIADKIIEYDPKSFRQVLSIIQMQGNRLAVTL